MENIENIDALFARTLAGDHDDEAPWEAVRTLRRMGNREVFGRAAEWCRSDDPLKRARGADVLSQLGKTVDHPHNAFPDESFSTLAGLVESEQDPLPLQSAVHALGHIENPLAVPLVAAQRFHSNADVRFAVACALGNFADDPRSTGALISLMQDVDDEVRDWASFGLGVQGNLDSEEIRDALWKGVSDSYREVREESLVGLAKRKDERVLQPLLVELNKPEISDRVLESAAMLLGEENADSSPAEYIALLKRRFSA